MTFIAKDSRWMPQLGSQNLEFGIHARIPNSEFPIPGSALAWSVWGLAATYYLAAFYLRSSPAVMTTELMRDFGISASQLGNFSAVYFYAYIAMQIPTGVLVDSWGARRLLIGGAIAAAIGTCLFGATSSYWVASIGRLIVGAATAVGWVVTLKLASHWFPRERFAMLSGLGLMMGNVGALVAQVPLRLLVEQFGWRAVALGSAAVVLLVGAAAWTFVTNDPLEKGFQSYAPLALPVFPVVAAVTSFACGAVVLGFAFARESVPVQLLGTISGAINVGNMLGPTILQPAIGRVLDQRWAGALNNGVRVYSVEAFQAGFAMIVAWSVLTCLLIACARETRCRPSA